MNFYNLNFTPLNFLPSAANKLYSPKSDPAPNVFHHFFCAACGDFQFKKPARTTGDVIRTLLRMVISNYFVNDNFVSFFAAQCVKTRPSRALRFKQF